MENQNNNTRKQRDGNASNNQDAPQREHMGEIGKDQNIGGGDASPSTGGSTVGSPSTGNIEKDTSDGLSD